MTLSVRLLLAFTLTHLVFAAAPGIDLWVSALFYDGANFPLLESDALNRVRYTLWYGAALLGVVALLLWPVWFVAGPRRLVPPRIWGFVGLTFLLGPGLLVSEVLKEHWGRARPDDVTAFGGEVPFTPPFQITDGCDRNCSFVSGEASAVAALAIVVGVLAWPHLGRRGRWFMATVLTVLGVLGGGLRIATGRHFLSDVVFAGFLVAFVALALFHLLRIESARRKLTPGNVLYDLRLMRRPFRR